MQSNFKVYSVRKKANTKQSKDAPKESEAEQLEIFPKSEFLSENLK